nr:unnamed protein product [Haemonchus contortus]
MERLLFAFVLIGTTLIQQYSASVGNFSDLNCTNTDGYFTWTFKLTDANCSIVKAWIKQIVASSSFYKAGYTSCGSETETAYVILILKETYSPSERSRLDDYNQTATQQSFASLGLGDLSDMNVTDVDGHFAFTYTFSNANCTKVKAWVKQGMKKSVYYSNATVTCVHTGTPTSGNENLIEITTPPPTAATPTPLVIAPDAALPVAPLVIPYQLDYEETAEHVEESVSSFESMSFMNL